MLYIKRNKLILALTGMIIFAFTLFLNPLPADAQYYLDQTYDYNNNCQQTNKIAERQLAKQEKAWVKEHKTWLKNLRKQTHFNYNYSPQAERRLTNQHQSWLTQQQNQIQDEYNLCLQANNPYYNNQYRYNQYYDDNYESQNINTSNKELWINTGIDFFSQLLNR